MIVTCPQCSARYNLTVAQLGPEGRTLRCSKCSHQWHQEPEITNPHAMEEGAVPPLPPVNPVARKTVAEDMALLTAAASHRKSVLVMAGGVAVGIVVLIAASWFWFNSQQALQSAGEESIKSAHTALMPAGFELSNVERQVVEQGDLTVLVFKGDLTNTSQLIQPVPEIMVTLISTSGRVLDHWPAQVEASQIDPDGTVKWLCRFLNPPLGEVADYQIKVNPQH